MTIILPTALRRSRFDVDWEAKRCLAAREQALDAVTGQVATFTRAATTTALDQNGVSRSIAYGLPAFEWHDLDGDTVRETPGVLLSTSDVLYLAYYGVPQARTWLVDFIDKSATGAATGTRIIEVGNSGAATGYFAIRRAAGGYDAVFHNGTSSVTASVACTVVSGDHIRLRLCFAATGALTLSVTQNAAAEVNGSTTATLTLQSAWNQPRLSIGSDYSGANRGTQSAMVVRTLFGVNTLTVMQAG